MQGTRKSVLRADRVWVGARRGQTEFGRTQGAEKRREFCTFLMNFSTFLNNFLRFKGRPSLGRGTSGADRVWPYSGCRKAARNYSHFQVFLLLGTCFSYFSWKLMVFNYFYIIFVISYVLYSLLWFFACDFLLIFHYFSFFCDFSMFFVILMGMNGHPKKREWTATRKKGGMNGHHELNC